MGMYSTKFKGITACTLFMKQVVILFVEKKLITFC